MELLLKNGDYLPDGKGGFVRAVGGEEMLQRVLFKLTAHRGGFPMIPELGSRLFELHRHRESQWESLARQYASEALRDEEELTVERVTVVPAGEALSVAIFLRYQGERMDVTVEV